MREIMVRFRSFRDIQDFATLCGRQSFRIQVGTEGYRVNATSIMGMFSLNCRKPLRVCITSTQEEFDRFCQEISCFLIEN